MADERNPGVLTQVPVPIDVDLQSGICRPHRRPFAGQSCCVTPDKPPKTPDPAIYSQREQMSLGLEPSWNNRDFPQDLLALIYDPHHLPISTTCRIHNRSDVAAVGVLVSVSFSRFGIGLARQPLANIIVGLGPGRGEDVDVPYPQTLLAELGHLPALFIQIHHSLDKNLINNYGEHAEQLHRTAEVGRAFTLQFPVRNDAPVTRQINLAVLTNDLGAALSLTNKLFAPFEQINVSLNVVIPATITGSVNDPFPPQRTLTVMAQDAGGQLIGGISYIIRIDS